MQLPEKLNDIYLCGMCIICFKWMELEFDGVRRQDIGIDHDRPFVTNSPLSSRNDLIEEDGEFRELAGLFLSIDSMYYTLVYGFWNKLEGKRALKNASY